MRVSPDAQLLAEGAPKTRRRAPDSVLQLHAVPLPIGFAHGGHVRGVPVEAYEARREQLVAELILLGSRDGVVEEESVADGAVDDAVEDMCEEFTLENM